MDPTSTARLSTTRACQWATPSSDHISETSETAGRFYSRMIGVVHFLLPSRQTWPVVCQGHTYLNMCNNQDTFVNTGHIYYAVLILSSAFLILSSAFLILFSALLILSSAFNLAH
ncbi:hypothetical protein BDR03DRAFT_948356 [Suillus americanus]|nr:hypothetical protein BDR03DRAFT_948356 [Suillus americanus]